MIGSAHSFNDIADTDGLHISVASFTDIQVNVQNEEVTFGAGITYTQLIAKLTDYKMAIENLPSLPHLNVVGSVVTGTHGSGIHHPGMASLVKEISFVDPSGRK